MAFNPAAVSLTYKKTVNFPVVFVTAELQYFIGSYVFLEVPSWLNVIQDNWDDANKIVTYKLTVKNADNLAEGTYNGVFKIAYNNFIFGGGYLDEQSLDVTLKIVDTVRLSISKSEFTFSHNIGDPAPATQFLVINTENNWSIVANEPWVTLSQENGNGNQSIDIGVDVAGLAPGIYTSAFIVDDGRDTKIGKINLLINGDTASEDYLEVTPTTINFSEKSGQAPTSQASVTIDSSLDVAIATTTPWLQLSNAAFTAGKNVLGIITTATEALAVGNHIGSVSITSGYGTRVVNVLLRIVEIVTQGIQNDGFYYAKDRNILFLSTSDENAEALLEFTAYPSGGIKTYSKRCPFFENTVQTIIGLETEVLLKPAALPDLLSDLFKPLEPLKYDLRVYDKKLNSSALTERQTFTNLSFLNGKTPKVADKLSYIPASITTNADGVVVFSFISEAAINTIEITGDKTQSIAVNKPAGKIFTAVVRLKDLALQPLQKITITCGPVSVEVRIKRPEMDTFQLIWLNEWDLPEVMNLDGIIEIIEEDDSRTVDIAEAGKTISRIIDIKEPKTFRVNTGNIYSEEEVKWLATVLRSGKMWLEIGGERTEVVRTYKNQTISRTRETIRNYSLTFDAAVR